MEQTPNNVKDGVPMTVREISEYLQMAESTVYRLAQDGKLPGRKIGGVWRFPSKNALDEWVEGDERVADGESASQRVSESTK